MENGENKVEIEGHMVENWENKVEIEEHMVGKMEHILKQHKFTFLGVLSKLKI